MADKSKEWKVSKAVILFAGLCFVGLALCIVRFAIDHWQILLGLVAVGVIKLLVRARNKEKRARDEAAKKYEQQRREELKKCWAEERRLQEEDKRCARLRQQEEFKNRQQLLDGFKVVESWCRRSAVILDTSVWLDGNSPSCDFEDSISHESWALEVEQFPGKSLVALLSSHYCQDIKVVVPNLLLDELEGIKVCSEHDSLERKGADRALQRIGILQKQCKIDVHRVTSREGLSEFLIGYVNHMRKVPQKRRESMVSLEIVTFNVELAIRLRSVALGCDKIHVRDRDDIVRLLCGLEHSKGGVEYGYPSDSWRV